MDHEQAKTLIQKLSKGKCSPGERRELMDWWRNISSQSEITQYLSKEEQDVLKEQMWLAIRAGIHQSESRKTRPGRVVSIFRKNRPLLAGVAASLLLLIWFNINNPFSREITVRTDFGEIKEVTLPDNSTILLHGNSSVKYAKDWDEQMKRTVFLEGEAYFSVVQTSRHLEFTVHTPDDLKITVLGTKFNVNSRKQTTEVVLDEGRVRLEDKYNSYTMIPKEMVSYSSADPKFISTVKKVREKVSWKDRVLIFEDESLGEIAEVLEQRYGIEIIFENEAWNDDHFTGSVPTDSVLLFLDKIKKLYNAEVAYENGVYTVR